LDDAQARLFSDAATSHPFFWASFVLLGDGQTRLEVRP
jgi:CHAT domain-containing protein